MKRLIALGACAAAMLPVAGFGAAANSYPDRPIRLIVPQAPGSSSDIVSRIAAGRMADYLGQQIVIDNRTGATGIVGVELAARAAPNGYTLLSGSVVTHAQLPISYRQLPYDPQKDFAPISQIYVADLVLCVHPSLQARSVKEFIALAKARTEPLNMASAGVGSVAHLAGQLFMHLAGIQSTHVPYKGGAANIVAVAAGESQWLISPISSTNAQIKSGRLRALAVSGRQRSSFLPDLPTVAEAGVPNYDFYTWVGFMAPARTPRDIVQKLHAVTTRAVTSAEVRDQYSAQGVEPRASASPEEFAAFIAAEQKKMRDLAQVAGIKPE